MSDGFSHLDEAGRARMVDVSDKPTTHRTATASATLRVPEVVMQAIRDRDLPKGDIYEAARIAGILAAKRTPELVPLCHSLHLDHVDVRVEPGDGRIRIVASARTRAATGVEMEALTAVSIAALTLYDMLKALSHDMVIEDVRLLEKSGGQSGTYRGPEKEREHRS